MNDILERIKELEKEIEHYPKGTLIYKNINGKLQPYLQLTINHKSISHYIKKEGREQVIEDVNKRNELMKELKILKENKNVKETKEFNSLNPINPYHKYKLSILLDHDLKNFCEKTRTYKTRLYYKDLTDYLYNDNYDKVFILYGLRRTGKTTLMEQAILNMSEDNLSKTAFLQVGKNNTIAELYHDLKLLRSEGYHYIFIDEVTILSDFIEGSAFLSDIYVSCGMKIVLSGTDSLGFLFANDDQLYDRSIFVHTTFISYHEFESVLGLKGIDNYITYGGTMSLSGIQYNKETPFSNEKTTSEYVDSAIASNIQHSLKHYQYGSHFRHLKELYDHQELTSVINRIIEDMNHAFTLDVLTKDFRSNDLGISSNNLRKEGITTLDDINKLDFTNRLKAYLEIKNKKEQTITIEEVVTSEIKEYLYLLDLISKIDVESIQKGIKNEEKIVFTQPGMRYAIAKSLIKSLLKDDYFDSISVTDKRTITLRILNEIKGRMMEDIVLLETKMAKPDKKVFKLKFSIGEFDMVVMDEDELNVEIYEIKYSEKIVPKQYKNLLDQEKEKETEFRYGKILNKTVLYRGATQQIDNGIIYLNVEEYLNNLYKEEGKNE